MALPGEQYKPCHSCIQSETRLADPLRNQVHIRLKRRNQSGAESESIKKKFRVLREWSNVD